MMTVGGTIATAQRVELTDTGISKHIYLCVQAPGGERVAIIMHPEQAIEVAAGLLAEATSVPQVLS